MVTHKDQIPHCFSSNISHSWWRASSCVGSKLTSYVSPRSGESFICEGIPVHQNQHQHQLAKLPCEIKNCLQSLHDPFFCKNYFIMFARPQIASCAYHLPRLETVKPYSLGQLFECLQGLQYREVSSVFGDSWQIFDWVVFVGLICLADFWSHVIFQEDMEWNHFHTIITYVGKYMWYRNSL